MHFLLWLSSRTSKHSDYIDYRVEVLDRNDVPVGRVAVSVVAQKALQSVALTR